MQTYLTLVTFVSLAGFYAATIVLARAIPAFILGIDAGPAARHTLALGLGIGTTTFALWRVHWTSLRRLWAERLEDGRRYLFLVSSLGVVATAVSGGRFVAHVAALVLDAAPTSHAGWADLLSTLLLFLISWLLWHHHWTVLQPNALSSPVVSRRRPTTGADPLPDRSPQRRRQAA